MAALTAQKDVLEDVVCKLAKPRWLEWQSQHDWSWGSWDGSWCAPNADAGWGAGDWAGGHHSALGGQDWCGYTEAYTGGYQEIDPRLPLASMEAPLAGTGGAPTVDPPDGSAARQPRWSGRSSYEELQGYPQYGARHKASAEPMLVHAGAAEDEPDPHGDDWGSFLPQPASSSSNAPATTPASELAEADLRLEDPSGSKVETGAPRHDVVLRWAASFLRRRRKPHERQPARLWCHIFLHKGHPEFDLVPMLIGKGGCNMRDIYSKTHCKIRVRGRGSGHLEVDGKKEAPVPLMVAVTANVTDAEGFKTAIQLTLSRLSAVDNQFYCFCQSRSMQVPSQPLFTIGELSKGAEQLLGDALRDAIVDSSSPPSNVHFGRRFQGSYDTLVDCLCNAPWASFRVKSAVLTAAHRAAAPPVMVRPLTEEAPGLALASAGSEEDVELPALISSISSQVEDFLNQADGPDSNLDS